MRLTTALARRARDPRARRFRMSCRGIVSALIALTIAPPTVASAAPPALTREVTLQGSSTGWVAVTLPRDITFAPSGQPQVVKVGNAAAFAGVVLVRQQKGPMPPGAGVFPLPAGAGRAYGVAFFGHDRGTLADDDEPVFFTRKLRAGTYRMFLLTRGTTKVSATVRFPVGSGRRAFTVPRNTVHHDTAALSPGAPGTAVASTQSHSGTADLARRGLLLGISWWDGDMAANRNVGSCFYSGPLPDLGPAPACPNGLGAVAGGDDPQKPESRLTVGYTYVGPARWLQKTYFVVGGPLKYAGIALYWLDLGAGFPA